MSTPPVSDRTISCPHCSAQNTLVGTDLAPNTTIACSSCGETIGTFAEMSETHINGSTQGADDELE